MYSVPWEVIHWLNEIMFINSRFKDIIKPELAMQLIILLHVRGSKGLTMCRVRNLSQGSTRWSLV